MRTLEELINKEEPGWDLVQEWLQEAINSYEVLPRDAKRAETELLNAQITTRSPMGAIIYETGGILIDGGWIRLLGSVDGESCTSCSFTFSCLRLDLPFQFQFCLALLFYLVSLFLCYH